jgi:hypothetical protein
MAPPSWNRPHQHKIDATATSVSPNQRRPKIWDGGHISAKTAARRPPGE